MYGKTEFVEMLINQIPKCVLNSRKPKGSERDLFSEEINNVCECQLTKLGRDSCRLVGAESMITSLVG